MAAGGGGRLSRSLLRSFLRFGSARRFPRSAPLVLQRLEGVSAAQKGSAFYRLSMQYSPLGADAVALGQFTLPVPPLIEQQQLVLTSGRALAALCKRVFAESPSTSDSLDQALDALKQLNAIWREIDDKAKQRELNASDEVLQHRKFRVGQVVAHKDSGTRAVVVGWVIGAAAPSSTAPSDPALKTQYLNILVDQLDSADLLRLSDPLVKPQQHRLAADLFAPVTDPALLRVHHEAIGGFFSSFDASAGCYRPNAALQFSYPRDYDNSSSSSAAAVAGRETVAAARRVADAVRTLGGRVLRAAERRGVVPISPTGSRDPTALFNSGPGSGAGVASTAKDIAACVLDDVLLPAQHCRQFGLSEADLVPAFASASTLADDDSNQPRLACAALQHLSSLFGNADQLLQLRYQHRGVGFFEEVVPDLSKHILPNSESDSPAPSPEPRPAFKDDSTSPPVRFGVGQVVRHKKFGYRGVITGYDVRPLLDVQNWEGVVGLPSGSEQPFYRVLPDEGDVRAFLGSQKAFRASYYCAQENLQALEDPSVEAGAGAGAGPTGADSSASSIHIQHRHVPLYFRGFDYAAQSFRVPHKLRFCFPRPAGSETTDGGTGVLSPVMDPAEALGFADADAVLAEAYALVKAELVHSRVSHARSVQANETTAATTTTTHEGPMLRMEDLLLLLRHATRKEDALVIESVLWIIWMSHADAAVCRAMRQGVSNMKRGRSSHAFDAFSLAARLDPNYAEPLNKLAALHHKASEYAQCSFRARAALDLLPSHYGALAGLGLSQERAGDSEGAVKSLRRALELHPFASHLPTVLNTLLMDVRDAAQQGAAAGAGVGTAEGSAEGASTDEGSKSGKKPRGRPRRSKK